MSGTSLARLGLVVALVVPTGLACVRRPPSALDAAKAPRNDEPRRTTETEGPTATAPTAPRILPEPDGAPAAEPDDGVRARLTELLGVLAGRELTDAQREDRDAGVSFLAEAQEAIDKGEHDRAGMLVDKARILLESLERATRP